ncbi:unnamed protein product [Strongylus vulgaris]|uniref:Uncharacterized protein n=1 Tax=Strongylus vulgaris TaxID=40348 RepID=A0A3P7J964_STRVU|nr:unnamed protein product [Strongylus vulgaris]
MELQQIREKRRRNVVVNINPDMSVTEGTRVMGTENYDPVIESIIDKSEERRRAADAAINSAVDAHWVPKGFVPKYDQSCGNRFQSNANEFADVDALCMMNEELSKLEVERRGYTIALPQPCASLVSHGIVNTVTMAAERNNFFGMDEDEEALAKGLMAKTLLTTITYPLSCAKTLIQLGHEPFPLSTGRTLIVAGRNAYFLPNVFSYGEF